MTDKPVIGLVGTFQNGKSTFVNCLFGRELAAVGGYGVSVTSANTRYVYDEYDYIEFIHNGKILGDATLSQYLDGETNVPSRLTEIIIHCDEPLLKNFDVVDTPGFNASESDTAKAMLAVKDFDLAIVVVRNKGLSQSEIEIARYLSSQHVPFYIVMNTYNGNGDDDLWNPNSKSNKEIAKAIWGSLVSSGSAPMSFSRQSPICSVNLIWYWLSVCERTQNRAVEHSRKVLSFYWEDVFNQKLSTSALSSKSRFLDLRNTILERDFICLAQVAKNRKWVYAMIHKTARRVVENFRLSALDVWKAYELRVKRLG